MEASTSMEGSGPHQHTCPVCASTFPRLDYLTHHMGIHIDETPHKPFTCKICGQGFQLENEFREHERSHKESKEKPFRCTQCNEQFALKSSLTQHQTTCKDSSMLETYSTGSELEIPDFPDREKPDESEEEPVKRPSRKRSRNQRIILESESEGENEGYRCKVCDKSFRTAKMLTRHAKTHKGGATIYSCRLCVEGFETLGQLRRHKKTHTSNLLTHYEQEAEQLQQSLGVDPDTKPTADQDSESQNDISPKPAKRARRTRARKPTDRSKRRPGRPMKSEQKDKSGENGEEEKEEEEEEGDEKVDQETKVKRRSVRRTSDRDISPCNVCGRKFERDNDKNIHMRYHTGEKPFACGTCGKGFHTKGNMLAHLQIHNPDRPYECEKCDKKFISKAALQRHSLTHTGEKPYQCDLCERSFRHWTSLKLHKDRTHFKLKPYACERCDKAFVSPDALKVHMRSHTGERPYQCDMCDKAFAQHAGLHAHRRTHTGEKPYVCKICFKGFYQSSALKDHNLTHTGEKPLKCDVCNRAFALKCALKRHIRTHTGERPYHCEICKKSFPASGELKLHMRKHTGEKPYQCELCGQAFASRSNFKKHLKEHHPGYVLATTENYRLPPLPQDFKDSFANDQHNPLYTQKCPSTDPDPQSDHVSQGEQLDPTQYQTTEKTTKGEYDMANKGSQYADIDQHYETRRNDNVSLDHSHQGLLPHQSQLPQQQQHHQHHTDHSQHHPRKQVQNHLSLRNQYHSPTPPSHSVPQQQKTINTESIPLPAISHLSLPIPTTSQMQSHSAATSSHTQLHLTSSNTPSLHTLQNHQLQTLSHSANSQQQQLLAPHYITHTIADANSAEAIQGEMGTHHPPHSDHQIHPQTSYASWGYSNIIQGAPDLVPVNFSMQREAELLLMMKNVNRELSVTTSPMVREPAPYTDPL